MTQPEKPNSRRTFLRWACAAAAAPLLVRGSNAANTDADTTTTVAGAKPAGAAHRVISANILLASPAHDGTPAAWVNRRDLCIKVLRDHNPDMICMQEVLRNQAEDLAKAFDEYQQFGFPGPYMDKNPTGYHGVTKNVIMFRKKRYEMTSAGGFWLSETPLIAGSVSWDALRGRHINWVRLRDRDSGKEFRLIDTHFDHKGQTARENQARMINEESAQYADDFVQILAGDFNAHADNPAIKALVSGGWVDAYKQIHGEEDPGRTYHALKGPAYKDKNKTGKGGRIDFIFYKGPVQTTAAEILKDHDGDRYPSDHYFLMADLLLK
jgi:endonuclease/exonuclease/phosphatase family metal-dependent hydrolase